MPRKSRRSKQRRRRQIVPTAPAAHARPSQVAASVPRQQLAARDTVTAAQFAQRHWYAIRDVKRTFIVAAICLALLIGLYFLID
jgi:hypothetical protein